MYGTILPLIKVFITNILNTSINPALNHNFFGLPGTKQINNKGIKQNNDLHFRFYSGPRKNSYSPKKFLCKNLAYYNLFFM